MPVGIATVKALHHGIAPATGVSEEVSLRDHAVPWQRVKQIKPVDRPRASQRIGNGCPVDAEARVVITYKTDVVEGSDEKSAITQGERLFYKCAPGVKLVIDGARVMNLGLHRGDCARSRGPGGNGV